MKGRTVEEGNEGTENILGASVPLGNCYLRPSYAVSQRKPTTMQVLPFLMMVNLTLLAPFNMYYFIRSIVLCAFQAKNHLHSFYFVSCNF